jgi:hypothetical protein
MKTVLAYRIYPAPEGTSFYEDDLCTSSKVECLFDYCQILEAIIFKAGWDYLVETYGYIKLFEINRKSGWHDVQSIEEFISVVEQERNERD